MSLKRTVANRPRRATLSVTLLVALAALAYGQAKPQVVVENVPFNDLPVELVGVELAGEPHTFAENKPRQFVASFDAPEDWLRQLSFKIRNRSGKTLLSATLYGTVAAGQAGEVPMGIEARYGQELDESGLTGRAPRGEPRSLASGETADVRWSEAEYAGLTKFLSTKRPVAAYRRMRIDLRQARFDDGTVWEMGRLYRIDPLDPRKWTPLDNKPTAFGAPPPDMKAGERLIETAPANSKPDSDPHVLVISEIKVAGQPVTPGSPFPAGSDWLRNLSVRVKNTSAKPITYVQLNFSLPEARYQAGGVGFHLTYGKNTVDSAPDAPDAGRLLPGEETELSFTDADYEMHRRFAEKLSGVTDFSRVRLGMLSVQFVDGTRTFFMTPAGSPKQGAPPVAK
ncbi:MAG TPA: hypothetical protein VM864_02020 [Pyrinomonadaceae bacterium]|jgi:hypothetical protein|nr:hypothetical protein [Pyrinomonadaceae bacterium]